MTPFYWGVVTWLVLQAFAIGVAYGDQRSRTTHLEKARKEDDDARAEQEKRLRAVENKPALDLSAVAEKIKGELQRELGERVAQVKADCIEDAIEVKRRVKAIEDARAADLRDELERLRRKESRSRFQAVRIDDRREPSDEPPSDTEAPPPFPPRPGPRRR